MTTEQIIGIIIVCIILYMSWIITQLENAPHGYQNDNGFHYGVEDDQQKN